MIAIKLCVDFTIFQAKNLGMGLASKGSFELVVCMVCFESFLYSPFVWFGSIYFLVI